MSAVNQIIEKYLDNPEKVSDEEMALLLASLEKNPQLAIEVKDQLMVNELLAQRYGVDRQDFMAQVDQRIRDFKTGEAELAEQVHDLRTIAEHELEHWEIRNQRSRQRNFAIAAALVVLIAAGITAYLTLAPSLQYVVEIEIAEGGGTLYGVGRNEKIRPGNPVKIKKGEEIKTTAGQAITFEYADQTRVHIGGKSRIEFDIGANGGKYVQVHSGVVTANVSPQDANAPMTISTNDSIATVKGTEFVLTVDGTSTRLEVIEGSVEFTHDKKKLTVQGGYYATTVDFKLKKTAWPTNRDKLVFMMQDRDSANFVRDDALGVYRECLLKPLHKASWNADKAMTLSDGRFEALGMKNEMVGAFRQGNAFTVEGYITPYYKDLSELGHIITYSSGRDSRNFSLSQKGDQLIMQLVGSKTKDEPKEFALFQFAENYDAHHFMVSYKPGRLVCYVDGDLKFDELADIGEIKKSWNPQNLVFGDEYTGGHQWEGTLEGIAIYSRFITPVEAHANATAYQKILAARKDKK